MASLYREYKRPPVSVKPVIEITLRQAIQEFEQRTGERITYSDLAARTGLARSTIEAIGSRAEYNPTLSTIDLLCDALDCDVSTILVRRRFNSTPLGGSDAS